MAKLTPMTQDELRSIAESCKDAVHDWRSHTERAGKALGTLEPEMDQVLAIHRGALAMLELADTLMVHKQMAEMRTKMAEKFRARGGAG